MRSPHTLQWDVCDCLPHALERLEPRLVLSGLPEGAPALTHAVIYPEGFAGATITEFMPIANPNDFEVQYEVVAHFEADVPDSIIATGTIAGASRSGITISRASDHSQDLVPQGMPYALELKSTAELGATLSHYDFGSAAGESFTTDSENFWAVPEISRGPGEHDFLEWYNPQDDPILVIVRFFDDTGVLVGTASARTRSHGRGGVDISMLDSLPATGTFGAVLSEKGSRAFIVASSRYFNDKSGNTATTALASPFVDSNTGVLPLASLGNSASEIISIINTSAPVSASAEGGAVFHNTITLTFTPEDSTLPPVVRELNVPSPGIARFDTSSIASEIGTGRFAVSYSGTEFGVAATHTEHDDRISTTFAQQGRDNFMFAEGFMDPARAGVNVFETLGVIADDPKAAAMFRVEFHFTDGTEIGQDFTLTAGRPFSLDLHSFQPLLDNITANDHFFYSVEVRSSVTLFTQMWHYDLTLGTDTPAGGFSTIGQPIFGE